MTVFWPAGATVNRWRWSTFVGAIGMPQIGGVLASDGWSGAFSIFPGFQAPLSLADHRLYPAVLVSPIDWWKCLWPVGLLRSRKLVLGNSSLFGHGYNRLWQARGMRSSCRAAAKCDAAARFFLINNSREKQLGAIYSRVYLSQGQHAFQHSV